jgi:hypothetical protein
MGIAGGPNLNQDGLVFLYDVFDQDNSYKGEPTENILYSGGDTELNDGQTWTNSGTWIYSNDDTSVTKPYIPNVNTNSLLIMSGVTETVGSQHIGCAYYASLTPSTTYTISVWFRQNRAGSNQPYFRTNINNNSLGNFSYNGDTNASNWPINQWIRISATATIQSNENGAYLSNYIGSAVGDKVWYFAPQLEAKSHMTPVTTVVRSATQGLLDVAGTNQIDLTNVSFDANAQMYFDGTDDYIDITSSSNLEIVDNVTVEATLKVNTSNLGSVKVIANKYSGTGWEFVLGSAGNFAFGGRNGDGTYYSSDSGVIIADNTYHHIVGVKTGLYWKTYVDGILKSTVTAGSVGTLYNTVAMQLGREGSYYYTNMYLNGFKVYNRAFTNEEVLQNYNAKKSRFNLK